MTTFRAHISTLSAPVALMLALGSSACGGSTDHGAGGAAGSAGSAGSGGTSGSSGSAGTGGCAYGGKTHAPGDSFPATDGCNTCTCQAGWQVACAEIACSKGCDYNGPEWLDCMPPADCGALQKQCPFSKIAY